MEINVNDIVKNKSYEFIVDKVNIGETDTVDAKKGSEILIPGLKIKKNLPMYNPGMEKIPVSELQEMSDEEKDFYLQIMENRLRSCGIDLKPYGIEDVVMEEFEPSVEELPNA